MKFAHAEVIYFIVVGRVLNRDFEFWERKTFLHVGLGLIKEDGLFGHLLLVPFDRSDGAVTVA